MEIPQILPALLSLVLMLGGSALLMQAGRERRKVITDRLSLIAQGPPARRERSTVTEPLLRMTSGRLRDADLLEIARICRRVGIPARLAPTTFAIVRLAGGAVLGVLVLAILDVLNRTGAAGVISAVILAPLAVAAGWLLPLFIVRRLVKDRAEQVSAGLPEALELLVVCVEAGLALEDGLDRITTELARTQPVLADELAITAADLKILPDRNEAFRKLADRVATPSVRSVVTTLSQTLRYGTPLAGALRVAAGELRNDALLALEERGNRLPSLMTVPMMLFIMPTIFLVVGGPAAIRILDLLASR